MRVVIDGKQAGWSYYLVLSILPTRWQGLGRSCSGYARYVLRVKVNELGMSDLSVEIMQKLASDMNKSKRQPFIYVAVTDRIR